MNFYRLPFLSLYCGNKKRPWLIGKDSFSIISCTQKYSISQCFPQARSPSTLSPSLSTKIPSVLQVSMKCYFCMQPLNSYCFPLCSHCSVMVQSLICPLFLLFINPSLKAWIISYYFCNPHNIKYRSVIIFRKQLIKFWWKNGKLNGCTSEWNMWECLNRFIALPNNKHINWESQKNLR